MATTNFYLDKAGKDGKCFIQLTYLASGQKFRHAIKLKVASTAWLASRQRLKVKTSEDEYVNGHLDGLEQIINNAQKQSLLIKNEISFGFVKQKFHDALGKSTVKKSLTERFDEYIEYSKTIRSPQTTRKYKTCLSHLKRFRIAKKYELTFDRINQQFYDSFVSYLMVTRKSLNNTIGTYVKTFKSFMNFCIDRGYCQPNAELGKFKVFKEDADLIYLSEEELFKIINLTLVSAEHRVVRDNFCFACFTGLRYSDISKVNIGNIKHDYIEITTEKTRDFLKIPLNVHAKAILLKNNGMLPKLFSNLKMNEYLKEIGELAEINERILITKYRGTEKVEFSEPKYKFMGSHTARRTFVTLSLEKGMRPETVMSITGHKDYRTFKKYIKLTDKVKLAEMNHIWATA